MTLPIGEDPTSGKPPRHEVVTTTTFKIEGDNGATGLVTDALQANNEFASVTVEYVNKGKPQQYRLFTAYRTYADNDIVAFCAHDAAEDMVEILRRNGVEARVVQVYGRLVTYGKI